MCLGGVIYEQDFRTRIPDRIKSVKYLPRKILSSYNFSAAVILKLFMTLSRYKRTETRLRIQKISSKVELLSLIITLKERLTGEKK